MEQINETYQKGRIEVPAIVMLFLLTVFGWLSIPFGFLISPIVFFICAKRIRKDRDISFQFIDWLLLLVCVAEIFLLFCSTYKPNSIETIGNILYAIAFWFFVRICVRHKETIILYLQVLSFIILFLSAITLFSYYKHRSAFINNGFEDLTLVRQYYHPLGFISNDWVAILLCLLPIPLYCFLISRKRKTEIIHLISFISVNLAILFSFSRGAYLSLFVFYAISFLFFLINHSSYKKGFIFVAICTFAFSCVVLYPDKKAVITTMSLTSTTSQQRSIDGRYKKWDEAINLFKERPLCGFGAGNYGNASIFYGAKDSESLSNRSTNSYLQLIVEKGIIGTIFYCLVIVFVTIVGIKTILKRRALIPFFASIMALLMREFFFSSFFEERRIPLLFIVLIISLFHLSNHYENCKRFFL